MRENTRVAIVTILILSFIFTVVGYLGYHLRYEQMHPCRPYYPYQIIGGTIETGGNAFHSYSLHLIYVKGKIKDLDEECTVSIRVTEQKYYDLIEKKLK